MLYARKARPSALSTTGKRGEGMARTIAKDHEAKREAILQTAARFFADHGYDRASMGKLAEACGVSKALIYHYYPSKDALLFDILDTHLTALAEVVEAAAAQSESPQERLRGLIRAVLIAYRDSDAEHKVQLDALSSLPEDKQTHLRALQRRMVGAMSDCIQAVEPKRFSARPELIRPVTMSVFGMLNWFYLWYRPGGAVDRDAYADIVADLVMGGVPALCASAGDKA
jgi:AcrR family transcriptional regulator